MRERELFFRGREIADNERERGVFFRGREIADNKREREN